MASKLAQALAQAFPSLPILCEPDCWVGKVLTKDPLSLEDLSSAIGVVEHYNQMGTFMNKLMREHPVDRPHQRQYDDRLLDVLTEACAFSWTDLRKLGAPTLCDAEGAPDISLESGHWVEAKAIHSSKEDAELTQRMLKGHVAIGTVVPAGPGLLNKFDSALEDAKNKFDRKSSRQNVVFFNLTIVDVAQLFRTDQVLKQVTDWADQEASSDPVTTIVVCYRYAWKEPLRDPFAC